MCQTDSVLTEYKKTVWVWIQKSLLNEIANLQFTILQILLNNINIL